MPHLGVNIDHVATLRRARYPAQIEQGEPDPVRAVHEAELAGAECITVHLREDRRHIDDRDLELVRRLCRVKVNLEMAVTDEMLSIARRVRPHMVTLVPEGRMEVTTEGGLDVAGQKDRLRAFLGALRAEAAEGQGGQGAPKALPIIASAFIDADPVQVEASRECGFDCCEVHTGPYAAEFARCGGDFRHAALRDSFERVADAGRRIRAAGMRFNAGHALNYVNTAPVAGLPGLAELHIGHAIVSRAVFVGLRSAVAEMKALIDRASAEASASGGRRH